MTRRQRRANTIALLIGLAATTVVALAYAAGALDPLERLALDWRFRHANPIGVFPSAADPAIVCIDIDDTTLARVGRWPWPRDVQAPLVAIPAELGARAVLVDLTWNEPEPLRSVAPRDADVTADPPKLASQQPEIRLPDYELQGAIAGAGNVYLAYNYRLIDPEDSPAFDALVAALGHGDEAAAARCLERLRRQRGRRRRGPAAEPDTLRLRARLVAALEVEPLLSAEALRRRLSLPAGALEKWFDRCLVAALRRRLAAWMAADPQRWSEPPHVLFEAFFRELTGREPGGDSPLKAALAVALRDTLGYEATTRGAAFALGPVRAVARPVAGLTPVYFLHARAARRCGFVVFPPDPDGVVRRIPLLRRHGDRLLVQIAFALACDLLGTPPDGLRVAGNRLEVDTPGGPVPRLSIQLDDQGRMLVPWVSGTDWTRVFRHVPADAIISLHRLREDLRHNRRLALEALWHLLGDPALADLAERRRSITDLFNLDDQIRLSRYRGDQATARELERIRSDLADEVATLETQVRRRLGGAAGSQPVGTEGRRLAAMIAQCRRVEPDLRRQVGEIEDQLRALLAGRVCLIGYTATSLADMKPIPTSRSAAGVMAHANLLNGMLSGQLVGWAPRWLNVLVTVLLGVAAALLSTLLTPRLGLVATAFLTAAFLAAGAVAFYVGAYWLAVVPAALAAAVSYVLITGFRFVFVEGERRQLQTALGQYTSREIARQMAENPELCRRAEMREVTAVFTDLKGFTSISERIGAQRTQEVLNVCLGRFTEVMLRHEAMVNKFIGDGIFAFWNPVIYPQDDHALRACETAVDLLADLDVLKRQRRAAGDTVFEEIVLRIGIATGKAVVGPCGSEQKYDYTCIGDSVNVAARLESANKFYGTQVLVSGDTRDQAGDGFVFRPLGGVQVKGKTRSVPIFELLGRVGDVDEARRTYAERFGEATERFMRREWEQARARFEVCHRQRPDDLAAVRYLEAIEEMRATPPGPDWNGALALKEK